MTDRAAGVWELVRCSTVRIESADQEHLGTGFFAAPGFVLTAAHVVARAQHDPAAVVVIWRDERTAPTEVRLLADPPEPGSDAYPWPDVAVLRVPIHGHPCSPLADAWPADNPAPSLYSWAYANEYQSHMVGGVSTRLAYNGPIEDTASPPGPGGARPRLLKLKWEQIIPGMSGAPVLDEDTWRVSAVMKRTRNDMAQEGGYATAIADVWARADEEPLVAELKAAHVAYRGQSGVDSEEAKARWGSLPTEVAAHLDAARAQSLRNALARYGYDFDLSTVAPAQVPATMARWLFSTDVKSLAYALTDLIQDQLLTREVAQLIFELVSCCLPVTADWKSMTATRPVGWWVPPEAADQLQREVRFDRALVAHVPAEERATIEMLVRRASAEQMLRLAKAESHDVQTPQADEWLNEVDAVIRQEVHATEGWWKDEEIREEVLKWFCTKRTIIPVPKEGPLTPADVDVLFDRFGALTFVLARSGTIPLDQSPRVVTIRPDVDDKLEKKARFYYGAVRGSGS